MNAKSMVHEVVASLRREGNASLELAERLEKAMEPQDTKRSRISPEGMKRIKAAAAAVWHSCPRNCGVKHRAGHPHIKKGIVVVPKRAA